MNEHRVELDRYHECLYDIRQRMDVIAAHISQKLSEKYLIIEVETVCLQFRKVLETIALMSMVANKEAYAEQNEKFAKHYHAERIMRDLERVNPNFYPRPIKLVAHENSYDELVDIEKGFLTKDEFVKIYEKCGGMMHARNPFVPNRTVKELQDLRACFPDWHRKITVLLNHHEITLLGGQLMVVAIMKRNDNGFPQAVIMERTEE